MSTKNTIKLKAPQLKYLLIESLKKYTDNVEFIDGTNPYRFSINKKVTFILIRNVHESGNNRDNQDECRIQISNSNGLIDALNSRVQVIVFGFYADKNVFTAWDPLFFNNRFNEGFINKDKSTTVSVYSRFSIQDAAKDKSISNYIDNRDQSVISFKPEYLGLYLENIEKIHFLLESELRNLVDFSDQQFDEDSLSSSKNFKKEKFSVTHTKYKRDSTFAKKVYEAYDNKCSMCGLGLGLIEGAHIVPHSNDKGTDDVTNGIALCALHHKAYDNSLIYFDRDYLIKINTDKIKYMEEMGLDSGFRKFTELAFEKLRLPKNYLLQPDVNNIEIANTIRGIV